MGASLVTPARVTFSGVVALYVFGAIVISGFDAFHTYSDTTRYAAPVALRAAWWTPVLFGASVGLGGPAYAIGYERFGGDRAPPPWRTLALAFVIFGALYFFSGFYHGPNAVKLAVLSLSALGLYTWLDLTRAGALCAITTALTGPLVEIVLTHAGTFAHLQADFLGIPMWLPMLYASSAPVIGQGARRFLGAR